LADNVGQTLIIYSDLTFPLWV